MAENIETKVTNLLEPIIKNEGYELYDVIYEKEGKDYFLRIIIDNKKGIDIQDCEKVNNAINDILDSADYIKEQYFLEVSSPGIERVLRKEKHFISQLNNKINIKLFKPIEKQKELIGILKEVNNAKGITIDVDGVNIEIDFKNIAIAKTVFDW